MDKLCNLIRIGIDSINIFVTPLSTIFFLYAAYLYMSSKGDAEKISKAHKLLLWAAIGYGFAFSAEPFVNWVAGVAGGGAAGCA
jgi:hypothetical protein